MTDKSVVPINWSQPIEAVHVDGRVAPARVLECDRKKPFTYALVQAHDQYWGCSYKGDVAALGWRIRNVASNPLNLETSDLDPITPEEDALATKAIVAMGWTRQSHDSAVRMVRVVLAEIDAEARIAHAEGAMWQALQDNGPPNRVLDWVIGSLGHLSDGLHDTKSPWADYAKRLYLHTSEKVAAFRMEQLPLSAHSIQSGGEGGEG